MRLIFIHSMPGSTPTHHPLWMPGPVLRGSGLADSHSRTADASAPPASQQESAPRALPGGVPVRHCPRGSRSGGGGRRRPGRRTRAPRLRPAAAPRGVCGAGRRGRAGGARSPPQECGLPPPPAATPPPAPAACARVSVCLSSLSTSVGISSQEVRE